MKITSKNPFLNLPKVVIFDLCGTIINSKEIDHKAINYTLSKFNKNSWEITRQNKDPLKSMKENFPNFFGKDANVAYNIYINYLIDNIEKFELFAYTLENLKIINYIKAKTIILTNRDCVFVDALKYNEEFKQIQPFVDLILCADEIGKSKPSPEVIEYAIRKINARDVQKSNIVIIGDALADMNTALSYQCIPVLLTASTSDITNKFILANYDAIYTASSHKEIAHCLIDSYKKDCLRKKINAVDTYYDKSNEK